MEFSLGRISGFFCQSFLGNAVLISSSPLSLIHFLSFMVNGVARWYFVVVIGQLIMKNCAAFRVLCLV
jgi:hypothetical protein